MAKVKKRTGVTGERNVAGRSRKPAITKAKKRKASPIKKGRAKLGERSKSKSKKAVRFMTKTKVVPATKARNATKVADGAAESRRVAIKPLDPVQKCGPGTSVQFLYRVDESVDGRSTAHLVFFDRHGWYCEHGRTCPAVGHAKKYNGQIARVS
ncbi:MAG: hypothetical protein JF589_04495 [Gemmatimonadetes bacterium]|nr:hypothetical protein [Gemmatimonadota bacterium]